MTGPRQTLEIDGSKHPVGVDDCDECWGWGWPRACRCGGEIHSQFIDESCNDEGDEAIFTSEICTLCGVDADEASPA